MAKSGTLKEGGGHCRRACQPRRGAARRGAADRQEVARYRKDAAIWAAIARLKPHRAAAAGGPLRFFLLLTIVAVNNGEGPEHDSPGPAPYVMT
eukprot:365254-Chlamydomonas_euryale.AAC.4